MNSEVQLVLYRGEKLPGSGGILVIVHGCSINVGDFLIESPLAEPNLPNLFEQPLKVIFTEKGTVLQTFAIQHIPLNGKFFEDLRRPLPKLGGPPGVHSVPN